MTIQNMKYIIAVADYQSFSQAAKALFVSQSTLSTAIREVENDLGIQIFNRSSRGISLTYGWGRFDPLCKGDCGADRISGAEVPFQEINSDALFRIYSAFTFFCACFY